MAKKLQVADGGVGPIQHAFDPDKTTLQKLFPDCQIAKAAYYSNGELEPGLYEISRNKKLLLQVRADGDDGILVQVMSPEVDAPFGVKVGSSYADLEKTGKKLTCTQGMDELSDDVVCTVEGFDRLQWLFVKPEATIPDGHVPTAPAMKGWKLSEIRWTLHGK
jgi:hypothetical protein